MKNVENVRGLENINANIRKAKQGLLFRLAQFSSAQFSSSQFSSAQFSSAQFSFVQYSSVHVQLRLNFS